MNTENQHTPTTPPPPASEPEAPARSPGEDELAAAKAQAAENWDKYLRVSADLDNYRKRALREKDEIGRFATERVITALLPSLDNLERALEHSEDGTPLHEGLLQVQKQFQRTLADFGLVELFAQPGEPFDPAFHEAVSSIESPDQPEGAVIEQLQSGYKLGDKLIRPARVVVSKGVAAS